MKELNWFCVYELVKHSRILINVMEITILQTTLYIPSWNQLKELCIFFKAAYAQVESLNVVVCVVQNPVAMLCFPIHV